MEVGSLRKEVKRLEDEALERSMLEQRYAKAKLELEVEKTVQQEKSWSGKKLQGNYWKSLLRPESSLVKQVWCIVCLLIKTVFSHLW